MSLPRAPFDVSNALYAGLSVVAITVAGSQLTSVTAATTVVTKVAHGLTVNQMVRLVSGTGFTGWTAGTLVFVATVPTADTFTVSLTLGGAAISVGTSSAGIIDPFVIFEAPMLDGQDTVEESKLQLPDANGVLRTVRNVLKAQEETFIFESVEPRRLLEIFSGALSGRVIGDCTLYIPDVDDAAGTIALKSEEFEATIIREGGSKFGGGEHSKAQLKLTSNKQGAITWTDGGAV